MEHDRGQSYGTTEPKTHLWFYVALIVLALALAVGTHLLARREIAALRQDMTRRIADVQTAAQNSPDPQLTMDIADAKNAIAVLRADLAARPATKDIADLAGSGKAMAERLDALQAALKDKASTADVTAGLATAMGAIEAVRTQLQTRAGNGQIAELEAGAKSTVDRLDRLQAVLATKASASDLAAEIKDTKGALDALSADVNTRAKTSDVANLATGLMAADDRSDKLQTALDSKAAASDLSAAIETAKGGFADLDAQVKAVTERLKTLQAGLSDKASTSDLAAQIAPIAAALKKLEARLDALAAAAGSNPDQPQKAP